MKKKIAVTMLLPLVISLFLIGFSSRIGAVECPNGYEYKPQSGVDCKQIDCEKVDDAHYGSTGHCVCGSSGSIYENDKDPNVECRRPGDFKSCPNCVYACVQNVDDCPDPYSTSKTRSETNEPDKQCVDYCAKFIRGGGPLSEVTEVSGKYPNCNCTADVYNDEGVLTNTIKFTDGDQKTTYTFNTTDGTLIKKESISLLEEREKIREKLGFKYSEEEIDKKLDPDKVSKWFDETTKDIKTSTSLLSASFWTQHIMAILDHGWGNSADFVDTYKYGRCGDSMLWLERELANELGVKDKKQEAFLSITGENYGNITNHTAIMVRPTGIDNVTWAEAVNEMVAASRKSNGLDEDSLKNIDPRILKAKVIDPYFKTETTVEKFIEGWSVIRLS